jgi:hypothetical protein
MASWLIIGGAVIGGIIGATVQLYKGLGYADGKFLAILFGFAGGMLGVLLAHLFGAPP